MNEKRSPATLGAALRDLREELPNFTISALAKNVGVDRGVIADWLNDVTVPYFHNFLSYVRACDALNEHHREALDNLLRLYLESAKPELLPKKKNGTLDREKFTRMLDCFIENDGWLDEKIWLSYCPPEKQFGSYLHLLRQYNNVTIAKLGKTADPVHPTVARGWEENKERNSHPTLHQVALCADACAATSEQRKILLKLYLNHPRSNGLFAHNGWLGPDGELKDCRSNPETAEKLFALFSKSKGLLPLNDEWIDRQPHERRLSFTLQALEYATFLSGAEVGKKAGVGLVYPKWKIGEDHPEDITPSSDFQKVITFFAQHPNTRKLTKKEKILSFAQDNKQKLRGLDDGWLDDQLPNQQYGQLVLALRTLNHDRQLDVANVLELSSPHPCKRWEKGECLPSRQTQADGTNLADIAMANYFARHKPVQYHYKLDFDALSDKLLERFTELRRRYQKAKQTNATGDLDNIALASIHVGAVADRATNPLSVAE